MTSHNSRQRPGTGPSLSPADHCRTRHQRGISAQCGDQAGRVYRFAGDSAFRRPFLALPSRMLDDRIRAGEHQARVTVVEAHEVGRFAARSADLDDLARPLWMAHDVAVHVEPLPEDCLHAPTSSSAFPGGSSAPGAARAPKARSRPAQAATNSIHPGAGGWYWPCGVGPARWHIFRFPGQFAVRRGDGHGASTFEPGFDLGAEHHSERYARPQRHERASSWLAIMNNHATWLGLPGVD